MPRRATTSALLLFLVGVLLAAPAQAKCCALQHLEISNPHGTTMITAEQLDDQLHPDEQGNLYWPVLNGFSKGDHRPEGDLGPLYRITYVLGDTEGGPVEVHEDVYLEAEPPTAFAPKGQTSELYPGDVREVPWGWRPFPERAANALLFLIEEANTVSLAGDIVVGTTRSWPARLAPAIAGAVIAIAAVWFFLRRGGRQA